MSPFEPRLRHDEYAALVEQAPILIWRADATGKCDYFNQRWLDFTGRTLAQELGDGWAEGVHPEDLPGCLDTYLGHFERRKAFEMEYRLRRHDAAWRWILDRGVPMYRQDGSFAGYIGSCVDVTDRVEAQRALAAAQAAEIQSLRDLLPLCMICKKIKTDDGGWEVLETYVRHQAGVDFSHGLCPDCYPHYLDQLQREARAYIQGE